MRTFVYPGTFDPFTNGHLDIARRAATLCDWLVVLVMSNANKHPVFSLQERCELVKRCLQDQPNVSVERYDGLLTEYMKQSGASACIRGLRSESDFRYEAEMVAANRLLMPGFESILLPCRPDLAFTSSSIVREVAAYHGDISGMVPSAIQEDVFDRLKRNGKMGEAQ